MPLVYDNIYEITRDLYTLIVWLQERELIGDFSRECVRRFEGGLGLYQNFFFGREFDPGPVPYFRGD